MGFGWKDLKKIVGTVAPTLGTAFGGPLGGMAANYVSKALLGKDGATEEELAEAIATTSPEKLLELKQADRQFALDMKRLDIDVDKLDQEDRASAREMAKANMWPQIIISALFIAGYFAVLVMMLGGGVELPENSAWLREPFLVLLGVITGAIPQILAFWLGSSHGSKAKDLGANVKAGLYKSITFLVIGLGFFLAGCKAAAF